MILLIQSYFVYEAQPIPIYNELVELTLPKSKYIDSEQGGGFGNRTFLL